MFLIWKLSRAPFKNDIIKALDKQMNAIQKSDDTSIQKIQEIINIIDELSASNIKQAFNQGLFDTGTLGTAFYKIKTEITALVIKYASVLDHIVIDFKATNSAMHDATAHKEIMKQAENADLFDTIRQTGIPW